MFYFRYYSAFIVVLLGGQNLFSQYEISGYLKNYDSLWDNKIFLEIIDSEGTYYNVSPEQVINYTTIDTNGFFWLKGELLPENYSVCRLSLSKESGISFSMEPKNYILLIVNNHSKIKINAKNFAKNPLNYEITGTHSDENIKIRELELLLDNLYKLSKNAKSEKAKELLKQKFYSSVHEFCDPKRYPLASIIALQNLDLEYDYMQNKDFYTDFIHKFNHKSGKTTAYINVLKEKIKLIEFKNEGNSNINYDNIIILILSILLALSIIYIFYLKQNIKQINTKSKPNKKELLNQLTQREKEIFNLLMQGYQNKEIASKLNLETSTVKTHLTKIYTKLNICKRSDAKLFSKINF